MCKLWMALVVGGVFTLAATAEAKRPKICADWLPYATTRTDVKDAPKIVVCFDGKRPTLMVNPVFVTRKDADGNTVNYAVSE